MAKTKKKTVRGAKAAPSRLPLSRERALAAAVALADAGSLADVTMRRLAESLGVEAMSLYHHLQNKDAVLDGMVDHVFAEIERPVADLDWKLAMRRRMTSVREVLMRHRWALSVLETRSSPGAMTLAHHDAVLGCLRAAGFSIPLCAHAYAVLDSFVFGFVHTELSLPFRTGEEARAVAGAILDGLPVGLYPNLVELTREHILRPEYAYANEFTFGLDLVLDGLERAFLAERSARRPQPDGC